MRAAASAGSCLIAEVPAVAPLRIGAAMLAVTSPAAVQAAERCHSSQVRLHKFTVMNYK